MSDLQTIQQEVGEWAQENFGSEQPSHYPLGGAGEEMGELMHSVLKRKQGIRLGENDVGVDAEIDAVGDIGIYLFDYLYREGIEYEVDGKLSEITDDLTLFTEQPIMKLGTVYQGYGDLWNAHEMEKSDEIKLLNVVTIFAALELFCQNRDGIESFEQCVNVAWYDEVQARDWDADVEV